MTGASSLDRLRRQYTFAGLSETDVTVDPIEQFSLWMNAALENSPADWVEPYAMTLATADSSGVVSARIVLLRRVDDEGFVFFSDYESQKGQEMAKNPSASLLFYWGYLERQVRIEGRVERTSREVSEQYFHSRPRGSQISASVSNQSTQVASRDELEQRYAAFDQQMGDQAIPLPERWGGYLVRPDRIEFWQGRENRLHDRLVYERGEQNQWTLHRRSP